MAARDHQSVHVDPAAVRSPVKAVGRPLGRVGVGGPDCSADNDDDQPGDVFALNFNVGIGPPLLPLVCVERGSQTGRCVPVRARTVQNGGGLA